MDEEPKSIWKKSWKGRSAVLIWCALVGVAIFLAILVTALGKMDTPLSRNLAAPALASIVIVASCLFVIYAVIPFLRWLFWKHWRRTLFGLACFATLIALFYAEEDWRGKRAWEKFKREWEAKGERFDWARFVPSPVPDDQNFALTPIVASSYGRILDKEGHKIQPQNTNVVDRLEMSIYRDDDWRNWPTNGYWAKGTFTDLKSWQAYYRAPTQTNRSSAAATIEFPIAPQPQSPAADVLLALSKYDSAIEELREASRLPCSHFPIEYGKDNPATILLPHLAVLKSVAQTLRLRAIAELQNGQSEKASADVTLMLYLNQSIRNEPVLLSHLVRIAMAEITLQPIYEGLAEHKWSDAQLAALNSELGELDFLADYEFTMRGERIFGISKLEYLRRMRNWRAWEFPDNGNHNNPFQNIGLRLMNIGLRLMPGAFFYQNELAIARMHQQWTLPMVDVENRTVSPKAVQRSEAAAMNQLNHFSYYNIIARLLFPAVSSSIIKSAREQSSLDLARVAIALERFRLTHGEYPESLDALVTQFMEKIPHDIINSQPLHYRRTSDGQFVLYSVGWNEMDDRGEVGLNENGAVNIRNGDWVWRYPSK